jgi:NAD+ diphosphatase
MSESFISEVQAPAQVNQRARWFIYRRVRLLVKFSDGQAALPTTSELDTLGLNLLQTQFLGILDGNHCYSAEVKDGTDSPEGWSFQGLRRLFGSMEETTYAVAGRAAQIVDWDRTHQFCGRCGNPTEYMATERAKECSNCGLISYPRISPAIIVQIRKDNRLLLARAHRHPPGFYSVLAGFVEPGETLEEAVKREIREEVGIEVKNIRYFGSQPWPFPNSLMIAFTCQYVSGEIELEAEELEDAGWFKAGDLPPVPPKISIARKLIDNFLAEYGT